MELEKVFLIQTLGCPLGLVPTAVGLCGYFVNEYNLGSRLSCELDPVWTKKSKVFGKQPLAVASPILGLLWSLHSGEEA